MGALRRCRHGGLSWSHNEVSVNLRRFDQPETEFFQQEYTWEADYIATRRNIGVELILGDDYRLFGEYQAAWHFRDKIGTPPGGPYENYLVLGMSKAFGRQF